MASNLIQKLTNHLVLTLKLCLAMPPYAGNQGLTFVWLRVRYDVVKVLAHFFSYNFLETCFDEREGAYYQA